MILNDTLQRHRECLKRCELDYDSCELERQDEKNCDSERERCEIDCDLDYGP